MLMFWKKPLMFKQETILKDKLEELNMKAVQTNQAPAAIGPYSQGIIVNNMFYSSGQIPLTAEGNIVAGGY